MRGDILILLFILSLSSCQQKKFNDSSQMMSYLKNPENGFFQTKSVNDIEFQLLYQPTDLLVERELDSIFSKKMISSLRKKYSDNIYFNLSISKKGTELLNSVPKDREEFAAMVSHLSFNLDRNVHFYNNKNDTIFMSDYIYPRMYGMSKATSILVVFPKDEKFFSSDYLNFTVEDLGLKTGEVKFKMITKNIIKEPKLDFE